MTPFDALLLLPQLIEDYKAVASQLADTQRELEALKTDKYVSIDWVAGYWDVNSSTARDMIQSLSSGRKNVAAIKALTYGNRIVRYKRSDIERISEANLVLVKDMLAQKRANKQSKSL